MSVTQSELGQRLKAAREANHLKQEDVAGELEVSRSTIAQIELGNRAVTSIELDKLSFLYGRDIREFLADEFQEEDALVALFRKHPEVSSEGGMLDALRGSVLLGREITNLERLLGVDRDLTALAAYPLHPPGTKWDAVKQGERIAQEERRRLGLGSSPLPNVAELLETQGVRTAQLALPQDVSGLTLLEPDVGVLVIANLDHHFLRRRFSYAHEYCHVLLDRDKKGTISRAGDRQDLFEVRANAFAAAFLMPKAGVEEFVQGFAKGRSSRLQMDVFDGEDVLRAQSRPEPGSQEIQMHDVVLLAHHFGTSRVSTLYRLKNLRLVTEPEFNKLKDQDEKGLGKALAGVLDLPEPDHDKARNEFRHRFMALGIEAFRRAEITRSKLRELAGLVGVAEADLAEVLETACPGTEEEGSGGTRSGN